MSRDWTLFFEEILLHGYRALDYVRDKSFNDIFTDQLLIDALLWNICVVGEASNNLPEDITNQMETIEWNNIIGMRNHIIHGYFGINLNIMWSVLQQHLPHLLSQLEQFKRDNPSLFTPI
ncbi:MAG: DUF86 domain-containing protein [Candidatus Symbiobacter sp.]|nr:DUF86 domain-containing protein [Candidatus Symbiobacter sp.]